MKDSKYNDNNSKTSYKEQTIDLNADRKARLANMLRKNLRRRKDQGIARKKDHDME